MGTEWILGRLAGGMESIQLGQGSDRWRTLLNTVRNHRFLAPRSWLVGDQLRDDYKL
jgi:hypothetical protein